MTGLTDYLQKPFDALYSITSNETTEDGIYADLGLEDAVYADTQSEDGVYSITSTQSGESTYAAYDSSDTETASSPGVSPQDREDSQTSADRHPTATDD